MLARVRRGVPSHDGRAALPIFSRRRRSRRRGRASEPTLSGPGRLSSGEPASRFSSRTLPGFRSGSARALAGAFLLLALGAVAAPPAQSQTSNTAFLDVERTHRLVDEGGAAVFQVRLLAAAPQGGLTVNVTVSDATNGGDFLAPASEGARSVTVPEGMQKASFSIPTVDDGRDEPDGWVTATLASGAGYAGGYNDTVSIALFDDDEVTGLRLTLDPSSIREDRGTQTVEVTATLLGATRLTDTTVSFGNTSGTAGAADAEIRNLASDMTIPAGAFSSSVDVRVAAVDDTEVEGIETLVIGASVVIGTRTFDDTARLAIVDDDGLPAVTIEAVSSPVDVGAPAEFTVRLSDPAPVRWAIETLLQVSEGSGDDFVAPGNEGRKVLRFRAGETEKRFAVPTRSSGSGLTGTVTVALVARDSFYKLGSSSRASVTVRDDDWTPAQPPSVSLSASPSPVDEGSPVTVTATLSEPLGRDVTIPLRVTRGTTEPGDYGSLASITIRAYTTAGTGTITTTDDDDADDETFAVALRTLPSSVTAGSPAWVQVTIADGDWQPVVQGVFVRPVSGDPAQLDVSWYPVRGIDDYLVRWKTGNQTYADARRIRFDASAASTRVGTRISTRITGLEGGTGYDVKVTAIQPGPTGPVELASAEASGRTWASGPAATIAAESSPVTPGTPARFRVTLSRAPEGSAIPVRLKVSEAAGGDVVAPGDEGEKRLWFGPGRTVATYPVPTKAGTGVEGTVTVALVERGSSYTLGDPSSATVAVRDDGASVQAPSVSLSVSPNPVNEGSPVTVTARLSRALASDVTIPITLTRGTAEEGDFGSLAGIAIRAGETSGTGTVSTTDDADADDETFIVGTGAALPSSVTAGSNDLMTVVITDNDEPSPEVTGVSIHAVFGDSAKLDVSWNLTPGADRYLVRWKTGSQPYVDAREIGTHGISAGARITGLTGGTSYDVKVTAIQRSPAGPVELASAEASGKTWAPTPLPAATIAAERSPAAPGTPARFRVTLSSPLRHGVALRLRVSASADSHVLAPGDEGEKRLWIEAGRTAATYTVPTNVESRPDGTVTVALVEHGSIFTLGSPSSATVEVRHEALPSPGRRSARGRQALRGLALGHEALPGLAATPYPHVTTQLSVSWNAVAGAEQYRVRWKTGDGVFGRPETVTVPRYSITGLTADTSYTVEVTAIDSDTGGVLASGVTGAVTTPETTLGVAVDRASLVLDEDGGTATYRVHLTGAGDYSSQTFDVRPEASSGDRSSVTISPDRLRFTADTFSVPRTVTILGVDDDVHGGERLVTVNHHVQRGDGTVLGSNLSPVTVRVRDDEQTSATIAADNAVTEGETARFTVTLSDASDAGGQVVRVSVRERTDLGYVVPEDERVHEVTVPAGQTSATLGIPTVDDQEDGSDGILIATVERSREYRVGDASQALLAVKDNDGAPSAYIDVTGTPAACGDSGFGIPCPVTMKEVEEGDGMTVTVTLASAAPEGGMELAVRVAEASGGGDYLAAGDERRHRVHIEHGQTTNSFVLDTLDNRTPEPDGTVVVWIEDGPGYTPSQPRLVQVKVRDNDEPASPAVIGFVTVAGEGEVTEGTAAEFLVRLTQPAPAGGATIEVLVSETGGGDYVAVEDERVHVVQVPAGQSVGTLSIATMDDAEDEPPGTVTAVVTGGAVYVPGIPAATSVRVLDDDGGSVARVAVLAAPGTDLDTLAMHEDGGAASWEVVLTAKPANDVTVTVSAAPAGHAVGVPSSVTFTPIDWWVPRWLGVRSTESADAGAAPRLTVTHAVTGYGGVTTARPVTVLLVDDALPGAVFAPAAVTVARPTPGSANHAASFTVRLDAPPSVANTPLKVNLKGYTAIDPGASATVTPETLTFDADNWHVPQRIAVRATGGAGAVDIGYELVVGEGLADEVREDAGGVTVTAVEPDALPAPGVTVSASSVTVGETDDPDTVAAENRASYTIRLTAPTAGEVMVTAASDAPDAASVHPASLVFTPETWNVEQAVTVTGIDDGLDNSDGRTATVSHDVSGYGAVTAADPVTVTVSDDTGGAQGTSRAPAVSVADARVREASGAVLAFTVTLDRAPSGPATVDYASADGTARAGQDYTATSGTLAFAAGETSKTVSVPVLDDAHDEGEETLTLTLLNATGMRIAAGTAVGTIENTDAMPKAWLARVGRTIGSQVVDALGARLKAGGGSYGTLGGRRIEAGGPLDEDGGAEFASPSGRARGEDAREPRTLTAEEFFRGTAFHLSSGGNEAGGPGFAVWGRFASTRFEGESGDVTMDGDVTTGFLGADVEWARARALAGLLVSHSRSTGAYGGAADRGRIESMVTGLYPYARFGLSERVSAWGVAGMGRGEVTIEPDDQRPVEADVTLRLGAAGVAGRVLDGEDGLGVNVRFDAMWVEMESDAAADLVATEADVTRLRLLLEGVHSFALGDGATFTPSAQLGLRLDGGDADTGTGVELGAGARYVAGRLTVEGLIRALVTHEERGYEEWGASGSVRVSPDTSGRGLSLSLSPGWGNATSSTDRLWAAHNAGALGRAAGFEPRARIEGELGYGLGLAGAPGVMTPYAGFTVGDGESRAFRIGARWGLAPNTALEFEALQRESANATAPEHSVMLRCSLPW